MDTFANSEYPEENNPAPEASFDAPQEPQNEAPQEPRNEVPQERQSEPQSGTYHAAGTGRRESPYANSPYMTGQPRPYQYQYQPQTQPPEKRAENQPDHPAAGQADRRPAKADRQRSCRWRYIRRAPGSGRFGHDSGAAVSEQC